MKTGTRKGDNNAGYLRWIKDGLHLSRWNIVKGFRRRIGGAVKIPGIVSTRMTVVFYPTSEKSLIIVFLFFRSAIVLIDFAVSKDYFTTILIGGSKMHFRQIAASFDI
jgi:hypothetical protein